jgi:hypothetical protein
MLGGASPAAASCAPPVTVAENAARAVAVVYGTVTASSGSALTIRIDRVLKGDIQTPARVFVGPARGGGLAPVVTSVDYPATVGSDHVLYVVRGSDGELETNACVGSHAGRPNDNETAFFGAGTAPAAQPDATPAGLTAAVALAALALAALALLFVRWRRVRVQARSAPAP